MLPRRLRLFLPFQFSNRGFGCCCDQDVVFKAIGPWWREGYLCTGCRSIPRERALMYAIEQHAPGWRTCSIHESSPADRGASMRHKRECKDYVATQYFPGVPLGSVHKGIRCENLENLTFEDEAHDLHITQDVFEHVLDPASAFWEIARTLRPGGMHIFTVPLVQKEEPSITCAVRGEGGAIEYKVEPEFHGNPISSEGSLVVTRWGYDICDFILHNSGMVTSIVEMDSLELGIRAEYNEVLVSRKAAK